MTARLFASAPKVTQRDAGERMKPPTRCQLCDEPAQVVFMAVREGERVRVSNPGEFMDKGTVRPEFVFLRWIARCGNHYLREVYRAKRGRWNGINDDGTPNLDDYHRIHGGSAPVLGRADRREQAGEARDLGADQADAAGPSGLPSGVEGDGRDDYRDSVRRAVGGKWDCYGGSVASGVPAYREA